MKLFRCFIQGENFPIQFEGQFELFGFHTARFVRAETPEEAELIALEMLRADPKLDVEPSKRTKDTMVYFESIEEIDSLPEGTTEPGTGFAFYRMGS
jgi:hypothetical protein